MQDQYFGIKELYDVVLRAKTPMDFGKRYVEAGEPVLYFENISMSVLSETSRPIFARGGWGNMPHVIWEDRSEVMFQISEGILSNISIGILLSAKVGSEQNNSIIVNSREGPFHLMKCNSNVDGETVEYTHLLQLNHKPYTDSNHKAFIFEYDKSTIQTKKYGKIIPIQNDFYDLSDTFVQVYNTKELDTIENNLADNTKQYLVDYYYKYDNDALVYLVQKERFNGLFSLEGKFYSKDENMGEDYTNIIYMPKVRVVSDINLRLGERANPTVATFNIIGIPETIVGHKDGLLLEMTRLSEGVDNVI